MYKRSLPELQLEQQLLDEKLYGYVLEFKFDPNRKFRADFAYPQKMLLIEVEGGVWKGRHTSGDGFTKDCEKYNEATILGYRIIRVTPDMINSEDLQALNFIKRALGLKTQSY